MIDLRFETPDGEPEPHDPPPSTEPPPADTE